MSPYVLISKYIKLPFLIVLAGITLFSCNSTKYLDKNEKLLIKNKIDIISEGNLKGISESEIQSLVIPRPNSKFLFMRLNLAVYNLYSPEKIKKKEKKREKRCADKNKEKLSKLNNKLKDYRYYRDKNLEGSPEYQKYEEKRQKLSEKKDKLDAKTCKHTLWTHKIGEKPVLYKLNDEFRNKSQIRIFLKNKGYYYSKVRTKMRAVSNKKVEMIYYIEPGKPILIGTDSIYADEEIKKIIKEGSLIKKGNRLEVEAMQNERDRIAGLLRNQGYYKFTKKYVSFRIDTLGQGNKAEVITLVSNPITSGKSVKHKKYRISEVHIRPEFEPRKALVEGDKYLNSFSQEPHSNSGNKFYFHEKGKSKLKPRSIMRGVYTLNDSLYRLKDVKDTYKYLTSLDIIKIANINFTEVKDSLNLKDSAALPLINCDIRITNNLSQSYKYEIEGTNTNGNLGAGGSFSYTHRNIFRGAELFNFRINGSLEKQTNYAADAVAFSDQFFNSRELGIESGVTVPRFVGFSGYKKFIKNFNPATSLSINYIYLQRPEYTRTVAGLSLGYKWNGSSYTSHTLKPIIFDFVDLDNPTDGFLEYINTYNLQGSYEDHFILGSSYSYVFNNSLDPASVNDFFFKTNFKIAGNSLFGLMSLLSKNSEPNKSINNNVFAQFTKVDIDLRYYKTIAGTDNKFVFRLFSGVVLPYGNLDVVPFGEKYFSGGANDIRAWQVRALGPGSYSAENETVLFPNRTADIKLEANFEYRKKLFWMIEGAFFIDAGNIWAINTLDNREGAIFQFNDFYKEIAIGTGLGFRLDFDLVIVRFDFGLKVKDPAAELGKRWIPLNRNYGYDDWTFNLGIGYPF